MFYLIVLWVVIALVVSSWALDKKLGFRNAFFISLLLSPVAGLVAILLSKNEEEASSPVTMGQEEEDLLEKQERHNL